MSVWQWIGLFVFLIAIYFMISNTVRSEDEAPKKMSMKTFLCLAICLLAGGGTMVVQKVLAVFVPNGNVATYSFLMFALNALILYACYFACAFLKRTKQGCDVFGKTPACGVKRGLSKTLIICGLLLAFAVFIINILVTELGKNVPSAILFSLSYAISILIAMLVGALYYKEKLSYKNFVGVILCVGALAIINFL